MRRIDWVAVAFAALFGLWLAADRYVGFPTPVPLSLFGTLLGLVALVLVAVKNWKVGLLSLAAGLAIIVLMDRIWKYTIHPTEAFKFFAVAMLFATPIIAGLGLLCFWRVLKRIEGAGAYAPVLKPDGSP